MGFVETGGRWYLVRCPRCGEKLFIPLEARPVGGTASRVCECGEDVTIRAVREDGRDGAEIVEEA